MSMKFAGVLLILCLLVGGCASNRSGEAKVLPPQSSEFGSEESTIGEKINEQILSQFYPYTDPKVVAYVNKIGNSLASQVERKDLNYRFTILYNEKIYAVSAPGGYVYLTTGLMAFLDNEAELAAVLAHEMGELQFRDPRLSRSRKALSEVTRAGAMVAPAFGPIGALAALGLVAVDAAVESRNPSAAKKILIADKRGLRYLVDAGYDPQGMFDVLHKFLNAKNEWLPYFYDYLQSRPITMDRFNALDHEFAKLPLDGKTFSTHRQEYQEIVRGITEIYKR